MILPSMSHATKISSLIMLLVSMLIFTEIAGLGVNYLMTTHAIHKSNEHWCTTLTVMETHSVHPDTRARLAELKKEFDCSG